MEKALIYTKIPKIMSLVGVIGKDRTNTMQGYKFRGIDDMYNALNEHLSKEGIFVTSKVIEKQREERQSAKGGLLLYSILTMEFEFFAEDGSSVKSTTVGEAMDSGDKSMNKAMSTAYKYALMQIFCIPTEEEKDTEYQSPEVKKTSPSSLKQTNGDDIVREPIDMSKSVSSPDNEFRNSACQNCGGKIAISKQGKPYCTNRCWLPENKHFITEFRNKK